jgi:hypothetical protein
MTRFLRETAPEAPASGRARHSVYEDRERPERQGIQVAAENPLTGDLEWREDWHRHATGWWPIDEFLGRRDLGG